VLAAGLGVLTVTGVDVGVALVAVGLAIAGLGNGVVYSASTSYSLAAIPVDDAAEASAALNMVRVLGLALGIALSNSIVRVVDDVVPGHSEAGLRVALGVAAVVVAAGMVVARGATPTAPERAGPR
jgi:dipeptide/tripeptide permease